MAVNVKGDGALVWTSVIDNSPFNKAINELIQQIKRLTDSADKEGQAVDNLVKRTTQAIATYASFATATNFVSDIVRTRGEFQQLEVAFNTMLGSKEKADKLMAEVTQFAATTPFELKEVAGATRSLLAFGITADKIKPTLKALGDVSAGVGAPIEEIAQIYGKARVQGRLFAEDINQLTGRGIPIIQELAKQFGVAEDQVKKLVESGQVGFPQIEKAFQDLTAAGSLFGGLMEAQSKTLTGQLSNLSDAWSRMLNDIGKSNEGIFSGAIGAAISLVENYQTVLDIIKVLILTYGTYRAAVMLSTAVNIIAADVTNGLTIAQSLQARAALLSERAMKLLNITMLSNPAVAVATGIAALVATLVIFSRQAKEAKSSAELLNEAQKHATEQFTEQETKVRQYVLVLNNQNIAESVRLDAYNQLKQLAPKIIENLTFQEAKTKDLTDRTNEFIAALRQQLKLQSLQTVFQKAFEQEQSARENLNNFIKDPGAAKVEGTYAEEVKNLQKSLDDAIKTRKLIESELSVAAGKGTREAYLVQIAVLEAEQKNVEKTSIAYKDYEDQIISLKKSLDGLNKTTTDPVSFEEILKQADSLEKLNALLTQYQDNYKKAIGPSNSANRRELADDIIAIQKKINEFDLLKKDKADNALEAKTNQLLEQRKDILQGISDLQRDAKQSGLVKEQTELDKINEKYDKAILKITDFNKKIDDFNRKNKTNVQKVGLVDIDKINKARETEISNQQQKEQFEKYKKLVADQLAVFSKYEELKLQYGEKKALELTNFQTGSFEDTIDALKLQLALLKNDITPSAQLKKDFLSKSITQAENDKQKRDIDKQIEDFKRVADATITFDIKRKQLETQYQKDVATLRKNYTGQELAERETALKEAHERELTDLEINAKLQSGIFKKLNENILFFSREQLRARAKELQKYLKDNTNLPPEVKQQIINTIKGINDTLKQDSASKDIVKDFSKIAEISGQVSSEAGKMADAFSGLNDELAEIFSTISQVANIAGNAASAVANFASGQIGAGISSTVGVIQGVVSFIKQAKQSRIQAQQEVQAFNDQIAKGEEDINLLYRDRQREQVKLNKLKLQGLQDERKLLDEQKKANALQFQTVLSQLQQQVAVIDKGTKKSGGILGIGKKTTAVDITESLAGKNFDQLEQLFLKGQLEGKAKDLFEQLQKIKQEGVDIDKLLEDNAQAAREAFTGTTADSITDSIIDGFKNGLRSARDFADNFEDLMRNAVLQSLKMQALEGPLNDFFKQFADASESDNVLTQTEIDDLNNKFAAIIDNAGRKFDDLQKLTNLDFTAGGSSASAKSLTGAIRGITEQQAELLAGQFGGLRLTALDHLKVASSQLSTLQAIQNNTAHLIQMNQNIQWFRLNGIKIAP